MQQPTKDPRHPALRRPLGLSRRSGLLVLAAVTLAAASCASHRTLDLVGDGGRALTVTAVQDPATDLPTPEATEDVITEFLALFDDFRPEAIRQRAEGVYAPHAYFNDGFVELRGAEAIARYLGRTAEATETLSIELEDRTMVAGEIYLRWVMRFTTAGRRAVTVTAPGMTHLRLDRSGRIVYHRDYWDAGTALGEFVPGIGRILNAVRSRL